jgi:hypothetical protein
MPLKKSKKRAKFEDMKDKKILRKIHALIKRAKEGGLPSLNIEPETPDSLRQVVKTKEAADTFMYLLAREAQKGKKK